MLRIDSLNKSFGQRRVLTNLSFHVNPGEIFGFVGSNGAGKTTTMRIMLGVMNSDSGSVTWNATPLSFAQRQDIGYMPEERGLYPKMTVGKQLTYLAQLHGLSATQASESVAHWTEVLGVAGRLGDSVQKLSLGNQQRVQLAAALVHNPSILVLDEPFSGLDPVAVDVMSSVLTDKAREGTLIIFSSHQLELVERLCDRVGIISQGSIVAEGSVDELRAGHSLTLAAAVGASFEEISSALSSFDLTVERDQLEGTAEVPTVPGATRVLISRAERIDDQDILRTLLSLGQVREFGPRRAHLSELFKDVVAPSPDSSANEKAPHGRSTRGLFGGFSFGRLLQSKNSEK